LTENTGIGHDGQFLGRVKYGSFPKRSKNDGRDLNTVTSQKEARMTVEI